MDNEQMDNEKLEQQVYVSFTQAFTQILELQEKLKTLRGTVQREFPNRDFPVETSEVGALAHVKALEISEENTAHLEEVFAGISKTRSQLDAIIEGVPEGSESRIHCRECYVLLRDIVQSIEDGMSISLDVNRN